MVFKFLSGLRKSRVGFFLSNKEEFFFLFREWFQWNKLEQN